MFLNPLTLLFTKGNLIECFFKATRNAILSLQFYSQYKTREGTDCIPMLMFIDFIFGRIIQCSLSFSLPVILVHSLLNTPLKHVSAFTRVHTNTFEFLCESLNWRENEITTSTSSYLQWNITGQLFFWKCISENLLVCAPHLLWFTKSRELLILWQLKRSYTV